MARDPLNRAFAPTSPDDVLDPPRFSQMTETVKDVLVLELRKFLANEQQTTERRVELPTVEKYATFGDGNDPFSTSVSILRKYPDRLEALPHVAVMASTGQERKLTVGPPYIGTVQDPSFVLGTIAGPYALADGDVLVIRTLPNGRSEHLDRIVFTANRFPTANPITAALAVDVARVINEQACHCLASVVTAGPASYVRIEAGGTESTRAGRTPTELEVHSDSVNADLLLGLARRGDITDLTIPIAGSANLTAPAGTWSSADVGRYVYVTEAEASYFNNGRFQVTAFATALGVDTLTVTSRYAREELGTPARWFIGLRDDHRNPVHPPKHRYGMAFDLSVQLDIINDDENTRGELVDLVIGFFSFFLEQKYFTFVGRTGFQGQTAPNEFYQIVLNPPLRNASENEFPRPSGDGSGKVYVNSFSLDVTVSMYLDREVYWPGTSTPFVVGGENLAEDTTLPPGC